jgi:hypothetical protein
MWHEHHLQEEVIAHYPSEVFDLVYPNDNMKLTDPWMEAMLFELL